MHKNKGSDWMFFPVRENLFMVIIILRAFPTRKIYLEVYYPLDRRDKNRVRSHSSKEESTKTIEKFGVLCVFSITTETDQISDQIRQ